MCMSQYLYVHSTAHSPRYRNFAFLLYKLTISHPSIYRHNHKLNWHHTGFPGYWPMFVGHQTFKKTQNHATPPQKTKQACRSWTIPHEQKPNVFRVSHDFSRHSTAVCQRLGICRSTDIFWIHQSVRYSDRRSHADKRIWQIL